MAVVHRVLAGYPQATVEELNVNPPSYCPPDGTMVGIIQENVQSLRGFKPQPIVSLGGTDARLWRYRDSPAYVYGPFPYGMARPTSMWTWRNSCTSCGSISCRRMIT